MCMALYTASDSALTLRTATGNIALLAGREELWEVGRFFMRCEDDVKALIEDREDPVGE